MELAVGAGPPYTVTCSAPPGASAGSPPPKRSEDESNDRILPVPAIVYTRDKLGVSNDPGGADVVNDCVEEAGAARGLDLGSVLNPRGACPDN